jgi:hypothetical protein
MRLLSAERKPASLSRLEATLLSVWPARWTPGTTSNKKLIPEQRTEMDDLVKQAKDYVGLNAAESGADVLIIDMADAIERLTAEVKRLRVALEPFAYYYKLNDCHWHGGDEVLEVPIKDLRTATFALEQ